MSFFSSVSENIEVYIRILIKNDQLLAFHL
jgi:hypothetical protein